MVEPRRRGVSGKISPEAAQLITMDEIAGRLADLYEQGERNVARGEPWTRVVAVTGTPTLIAFEAYSYTMFNDGPGTVFTDPQNPQVSTTASVNAGLEQGDSEPVALGTRRDIRFWIACAAEETATVRIRGTL